MSLGVRYRFGCDGCGVNVFVPRKRTRVLPDGSVAPTGDVLCPACVRLEAAGAPLRYDAGSSAFPPSRVESTS